MQRHISRAGWQAQSIHCFNEIALLVVHQNAAALGGNAGELLPNQKQLVDGVERDRAAAVELAGCLKQGNNDAGLLCEIIDLDAEVIFGGGAGDAVGGIYCNAVDKTQPEPRELAERTLV